MDKRRCGGRSDNRRTLLFCWTLLTAALLAVGSSGEEKPLRRVELLLLESHPPSTMTVGLHIELAPGWHLYWINPGDAGFAPEVTWDLPPGYKAGPLRFPIPEKIVHGDIVSYGFREELIILSEISVSSPPAPVEAPTIACRIDWMACRESCVTGRRAVEVSPAAQTQTDLKRSQEILSRFAACFSKPLSTARITTKEAEFLKSGNGWQVEILFSGKDTPRVSDFYPYPFENFVIAHSGISASGGKVVIPLEPSGPSAALFRVDGLLIIGDDAYEVSIPVKSKDHSS
jgi:DsbC/DsbD-like thiol-disulfide interchange protein